MKWLVSLALIVAVLTPTAIAQNKEDAAELKRAPAAEVREFEQSAFCRKYGCFLKAIEPMGPVWFYNYRVFPPNAVAETQWYGMQIGMRLSAENGSREYPYMIVRWFPIRSTPANEFAAINDLVREITSDAQFDASKFIGSFTQRLDFTRPSRKDEMDLVRGPSARVGSRNLKLDFTRGTDSCRYPQLTLMIE